MSSIDKAGFLWVPGNGPDDSALERMCREFPKPAKPMGEAWFLAPEREMYPELLGELDDLTDEQIDRPLEQIASGPSCFGQHDEWTDWYHYLLPRVIRRRWASTIQHPMEIVITGFMSQHPNGDERFAYRDFRTDALRTLGQCIMSPDCWPGGVPNITNCLSKYRGVDGTIGWYDSDGPLSASLFFCLKYFTADEVAPWFESVLAIHNPYWKAQVLVWLIGANPILTGAISQPSQFPETGPYRIGWEWSHALGGNYTGNFDEPISLIPFLPDENRNAILRVIHGTDFTEFLENWQTDPDLAELAAETLGAPDRFVELYGDSSSIGQ